MYNAFPNIAKFLQLVRNETVKSFKNQLDPSVLISLHNPNQTMKFMNKMKKVIDKVESKKNSQKENEQNHDHDNQNNKNQNNKNQNNKNAIEGDLREIDKDLRNFYNSQETRNFLRDYNNLTDELGKCDHTIFKDFEKTMNNFLANSQRSFEIQSANPNLINKSQEK